MMDQQKADGTSNHNQSQTTSSVAIYWNPAHGDLVQICVIHSFTICSIFKQTV